MHSRTLIVFTRNTVRGKVKSRIAKELGMDVAFSLHLILLDNIKKMVADLPNSIKVKIYYSDYIDGNDLWPVDVEKHVQNGMDIGERMYNALDRELSSPNTYVCIVGSDILELDQNIVELGFKYLLDRDIVIGPATDGGYYYLGLKEVQKELFREISWGGGEVLDKTLKRVESLGLTYRLLPELSDVDEAKDIPRELQKLIDQ